MPVRLPTLTVGPSNNPPTRRHGRPTERSSPMFSSLTSPKTLTKLALATVPLVGMVGLVAGPASAQPRNGTKPASCTVEDSGTGQTSQVPEGTRIGLFYCGSDGEWHFGTVQLDYAKTAQTGGTTGTTGGTKVVNALSKVKATSARLANG